MNDSEASLSQLHDLAMPEEVPWWPLATGWYFVIALAVVLMAWLSWKSWKQWQSNAYRRAARKELATTQSTTEIATVLRRCALAVAPRDEVAPLNGSAWLEWLAQHAPTQPTAEVGQLLIEAPYANPSSTADLDTLRRYASDWIDHHSYPTDA